MAEIRIIEHEGLFLRLVKTKNGWFVNSISSEKNASITEEGFLPFIVCVGDKSGGIFGAFSAVYKNNVGEFVQTHIQERPNEIKLVYESEVLSCQVESVYSFVPGAAAVYLKNTLIARQDNVVTDFFSVVPISAYRAEKNREYSLSYRRNRWQAEGQWYENSLQNLGFTDRCNHVPMNKFSIVNTGSQTTSEYYPCFIVENKKMHTKWFLENESDGNWFMELTEYHRWEQKEGILLLSGGSVEERYLFSNRKLRKDEQLETPVSLIAVSDADTSLTESVYKAKRSVVLHKMRDAEVIFNDYMNCLWAKPDMTAELSLINRCAELGVKYYVIDDGWFNFKEDIGNRLGDWNTDADVFGEKGLQGILDLIYQKGMLPGVWLEGEVIGENSRIYQEHPDWTLSVNGESYGNRSRHFLDFRKLEPVKYLHDVIVKLYTMGVRYLKTDYNDSYLLADSESGNISIGFSENYLRILNFYKEIKREFPDLVIECCASGGMREDEGILKYFNIQSISDQEEFMNYPSIICGCLMNNLPEKTGVWCMPYPVRHRQKSLPIDDIPSPSREEIIFNLVNGLTGVFCLSSRIDKLDESGISIVKQCLSLHKEIYPVLQESYPVFPLGITRMEDKQHALKMEGGGTEYLWLWATGKKEFSIADAKEYEQIFPTEKDSVISCGKIVLKDNICARVFKKIK